MVGTRAAAKPPKAILAPGQSGSGSQALTDHVQTVLQDVLTALDDSKAEEIVQIDLAGKTSIADVMIIATGRSNVHVGAIADRVVKALKAQGVTAPRVEGLPHCDWVLVDAGDVIVHVFRPEVRQFYNLEKMWGGGRPVETAGDRRTQ
jgi:ribosome-associated protein